MTGRAWSFSPSNGWCERELPAPPARHPGERTDPSQPLASKCRDLDKTRPQSPSVSPCNGRDTVGRCIESVLSQDFADLELIISDNASDDETIDTLESYARMDRRVRLSVNPVNIGATRT
jgi:cellulose synthase/poly-beta-1,6-N-acetylglucosamine synthase-like glycosyltransferase